MKRVEAEALAAQVKAEYAKRIEATIERGESIDPEGGYHAVLTLIATGAPRPRLTRRLRYPSQWRKALEAWETWLLTPEQLQAILDAPWPFAGDEDLPRGRRGKSKKELQEAS